MKSFFSSKAQDAAKAMDEMTTPVVAPELRQLPGGLIERDGRSTSADPDLIRLAADGWIIKQKIDAL